MRRLAVRVIPAAICALSLFPAGASAVECGAAKPFLQSVRACWERSTAKPHALALIVTPNAAWTSLRLTGFLARAEDFEAFSLPGGWDCEPASLGENGYVATVDCAGPALDAKQEVLCFATGDSDFSSSGGFRIIPTPAQPANGANGGADVLHDAASGGEPACSGTTLALQSTPVPTSLVCSLAYGTPLSTLACAAGARAPLAATYPVTSFSFDSGDGTFTVGAAASSEAGVFAASLSRPIAASRLVSLRQASATPRNRRREGAAIAYGFDSRSSRIRRGALRCTPAACAVRVYVPAAGESEVTLLDSRGKRVGLIRFDSPGGWSDVEVRLRRVVRRKPAAAKPAPKTAAATPRARKPVPPPKLGSAVGLMIGHTGGGAPARSYLQRVRVNRVTEIKPSVPGETLITDSPKPKPKPETAGQGPATE